MNIKLINIGFDKEPLPSGQVSTEETTDTRGTTESGDDTAVPDLDTQKQKESTEE